MDNRINLVGLEVLSEEEKETVTTFAEKELGRFENKYHGVDEFHLKIQVYHNQAKTENKKYSLSFLLKLKNKGFKADYSDWSLNLALKKVLGKVDTEIEHKFHILGHKNKNL